MENFEFLIKIYRKHQFTIQYKKKDENEEWTTVSLLNEQNLMYLSKTLDPETTYTVRINGNSYCKSISYMKEFFYTTSKSNISSNSLYQKTLCFEYDLYTDLNTVCKLK